MEIPALGDLAARAKEKRKEHNAYLKRLKKKPKGEVNTRFQTLHQEAFERIDCLDCANCCRGLGPRFERKDRERIAKHLGMKTQAFEAAYLRIDEDGDYVLQSTPCPFLGEDNACSIYEQRPKACRQYPHTDEANMLPHLQLALRNQGHCPAVWAILEEMRKRWP